MNEYIPLFVIGIFGVLLFVGTIIWTECLFPENKKPHESAKQTELDFNKAKQGRGELVSSHD